MVTIEYFFTNNFFVSCVPIAVRLPTVAISRAGLA